MDQTDLESLLATLRSAQGDAPPPPPAAVAPPPASLPPPPAQSDLDALLSTLTALPSVSPAHQEEYDPHLPLQRSRTRDVSALSFQEAMPVLNSLTMSNEWLDQVEGVWEEQKNWELRLKDERNRYEGELKRDGSAPIVKTTRLKEWDRNAKKRWAGLQGEQQQKLQKLGVPTFQKTTDGTLLKRQERVLNVLVGFLEDRES